jgi:recombinational DNA repair protein (RecF pathway)
MYQKYSTEALVLSSREIGENDRAFALFTKDFGLVWARASSVRTERSKMRYALQNCAHVQVSLVRGRRGWRLAGAHSLRQAGENARGASAFARVSELLLRLVHGEEYHAYLFAALAEAHAALMDAREAGERGIIEIVCVARVLHALGYLSSEALGTALFTHTAYAGEHLSEAELLREPLISSINRAIAEAHL